MIPQWVIEKKRDGLALSDDEIRGFIAGYTDGTIPDYQMAALAMAIYLRGMTFEETAVLTDAMMRSGDLVDTSSLPLPKADKHSTGGIGDKVSLILAPLAACCGVAVPMISGRGLGITGGTLDKMEAIPGYRVGLSEDEFLATLRACGCSMIGQTARLAPADRKLYALRDVTATVPSIPLITASIMCKKLAEGIDTLVLDVKWGKGAFMKSLEDARALAGNMVQVGERMGKRVAALLTTMNEPLGRAAGNRVEVIESVEALQGRGPADLMEVTYALTSAMLRLSGVVPDAATAQRRMEAAIASGQAFETFTKMVRLHGGDPRALDDVSRMPASRLEKPFSAQDSGYVTEVDADKIGRAVLVLGGGRIRTDDRVDPAVGITHLVKRGERVTAGQALCHVHANDESRLRQAEDLLARAFVIGASAPERIPLITGRIGVD